LNPLRLLYAPGDKVIVAHHLDLTNAKLVSFEEMFAPSICLGLAGMFLVVFVWLFEFGEKYFARRYLE
jgi:hypothetical protein